MEVQTDVFVNIIGTSLDNLRRGPKNLEEVVAFVAGMNDIHIKDPLARLMQHLSDCGPNDRLRHALTIRLQRWDHQDQPAWSPDTNSHTPERRRAALALLGFGPDAHDAINNGIPIFTEAEVPLVIAEDHQPWYEAKKSAISHFYWPHYEAQLARPKGHWSPESIAALDASTDDVLARLSDPSRKEACAVKGLVMGYVQSGKTSHFSGLIAKAVDAGYRFIVVFGGTMDILREQTQRRIDKELVGKELLEPDEYGLDSDWGNFVEHGGQPSALGHVDWTRLTGKSNDYRKLRHLLSSLEFKPYDPGKPFYAPENLAHAPARLAVIKKTPNRINQLCGDLESLKKLKNQLQHVPTLIIDDESDQASINTINPKKTAKDKTRTSTNLAIIRLLKLLPRAQYVGYTATPFANMFINPADAEDLFPKNFIVSLPRPIGYMGVSDFYDLDDQFEKDDLRSNKVAFVRSVKGANENDQNLPKAIDSFVLAGAIKLFRQQRNPGLYGFKHHTMLVHHSAQTAVHAGDAADVERIFAGGARYQNRAGVDRLRTLFKNDFRRVSKVRAAADPSPRSFDVLIPFISECVTRICDDKSVLIVNGKNALDTPDFDQNCVWAILVGGAKLSRGYTVEGLTTSYFRRPAGAGDTLMQMGRWFGFRPGYGDLVRLYIGSAEKRGKITLDLYEAFGAVCRDEEALRHELLRYGRDGITPKQVPPLVRQHLPSLPPAAKNKMFNAKIRSIDFAGEWTEKTSAPEKTRTIDVSENLKTASSLVGASSHLGRQVFKFANGKGVERQFQAEACTVPGDAVAQFLKDYRWSEGRKSVQLEREYLEKQLALGTLTEWVILLPQATTKRVFSFPDTSFPKINVIERSRIGRRFGVYSEPRHREASQHLAGVSVLSRCSRFLDEQRKTGRPVLVMYVVDDVQEPGGDPAVGFGIQFPGMKRSQAITWGVEDPSQKDKVVIDV